MVSTASKYAFFTLNYIVICLAVCFYMYFLFFLRADCLEEQSACLNANLSVRLEVACLAAQTAPPCLLLCCLSVCCALLSVCCSGSLSSLASNCACLPQGLRGRLSQAKSQPQQPPWLATCKASVRLSCQAASASLTARPSFCCLAASAASEACDKCLPVSDGRLAALSWRFSIKYTHFSICLALTSCLVWTTAW